MINLMFCGNDKALDGMIISLLSIVKYCKKPLNVYILTMDLQEMNKNYRPITNSHIMVLENIVKKVNVNSQIHLVDVTEHFKRQMLESVNIKTHYTPYILVRLFADKVKEIPEKILYLDCDLVIYKNIEPLYNTKIDDYYYAAVVDYIGQYFINRKYINSGVLLMNMNKMKQDNVFERCIEMVNTKKMLLPDQSALNKICDKKLYLPRIYNEQKQKNDDTVIRHFSMTIKFMPSLNKEKRKLVNSYCQLFKFIPALKFLNVKPWHIEGIHKIYKIHDYDDILDEYLKLKGDQP